MKGVIYKITNPKGKIYVGQSIDYYRRIANYKRLNCKSQTHLYNSFKKYGFDDHKFEILERCSIDVLGEREKYWKLKEGSCNPSTGLGIRLSEEKGGKLSPQTCFKISQAKKGKKYSKESSLKKSKSLKGKPKSLTHRENISKGKMGIPNPSKGKKRSPEFGQKISNNKERSKKISESHKGKSHPRTSEWSQKIGNSLKRPILQYDLEGNFIKEWDSAKSAAKFLNKYPSPITACCKGKQLSSYNFKWKYKNEC